MDDRIMTDRPYPVRGRELSVIPESAKALERE
jgi:hypothetical protein